MKIDVLCVGQSVYDLVFAVDHHPGEDEKCFASGLTGTGGGPAANAAITVARLGGRAALAGYLGQDIFGGLHFDELRAAGVITDYVIRGEYPTALSTILVKPGGKRTVVNYKGATPALTPEQLDLSPVSPKAMLFDGYEPEISIPLAREARKRNIATILDAGSVHKGAVELAPLCGYLVAAEKFALDFSEKTDPADALPILAALAPVAVITLGPKGLLWASGGESGSLPAFPVNAVDTTGAGDIFHGAFALRLVRGDDLMHALRYSSAAAALGCMKMGARPGIPGEKEVEEFLKNN
jgi:sulfofructose kinase